MLYMNFGEKERAMEFLQKRLGQGMEGVTMNELPDWDLMPKKAPGTFMTAITQNTIVLLYALFGRRY